MTPEDRIQEHLNALYGEVEGWVAWRKLHAIMHAFSTRNPHLVDRDDHPEDGLSERDILLITYGDQFLEQGRASLQSLGRFLQDHLSDVINGVHILPFYPYSSDDGFSVIDYRQVDPNLGDWDDIQSLAGDYCLMFDAVVNHISRHSDWFKAFQQGIDPFKDYFISVDPGVDLSQVVRPRALPLLTPVETVEGVRHVWTTFSEDQIDLNFANPQVLLEMVDLLLFYVEQGAEFIRLDAIAYLWKEIGTSCIHLPQTHRVVKLFRAVLDGLTPPVNLITETNVPHEENVSYFGEPLHEQRDGRVFIRGDEAQLVYQFPLAPLVLHTFQTGNAGKLSHWASTLDVPFPSVTYFNFLASHDGIGVRPAEGILSSGEVEALVSRTQDHAGRVSYRTQADGSQSAYELNITFYDALNDPADPDPPMDNSCFLASQFIMLSLAGVPGIYVHSLFGSRNCHECVSRTGHARSINRKKFNLRDLERILSDPSSHSARVFAGYRHLLKQRIRQPAFNPHGSQVVLHIAEPIFALLRTSPDLQQNILCLVNVSAESQSLTLDLAEHILTVDETWFDLVSGNEYPAPGSRLTLEVMAYQYLWLKVSDDRSSPKKI
jgi:glucosylglycerate phosphorylase